jgi:hypothetical protein
MAVAMIVMMAVHYTKQALQSYGCTADYSTSAFEYLMPWPVARLSLPPAADGSCCQLIDTAGTHAPTCMH